MFRSYIISALRIFQLNKLSTIISTLGLSIGLCSALIIFLFVKHEKEYDRFHEEAERIYRLTCLFSPESYEIPLAPAVMKQYLTAGVPEIQSVMRLRRIHHDDFGVRIGEEVLLIEDFFLADSTFFEFFSFPLLDGQPHEVLREPNTAVISRSAASKYFGDRNPVGQTLYAHGLYPFMITGIMEDFPLQSHFSAQFIANYELARNWAPITYQHWGNLSNFYYLKFKPEAKLAGVTQKINELVHANAPEWFQTTEFFLQPLLDVRLHSTHISYDIEAHGNMSLLKGLAMVAAIVLLLACVNYINLSTAQSASRRKEVGMRKVMGAGRSHVFWQSMIESGLSVLGAFVIALLIAELSMPVISRLVGQPLGISNLLEWPVWPLIILGLVLIAFLSGVYPACFMGRFQPADILKGSLLSGGLSKKKGRRTNMHLRQLLIVFQFCCATALIILNLSVSRQVRYMENKNKGYEPGGLILIVNPEDGQQESRFYSFKHTLEHYPEIEVVSAGYNLPSERMQNFTQYALPDEYSEIQAGELNVHPDYFTAIRSHLLAGEYFDKQQADESGQNVILNRTAVEVLGLEPQEAIGKRIRVAFLNENPRITGVIEDLHFGSLHEQVPPLIISYRTELNLYRRIVVRTADGSLPRALQIAERVWEEDPVSFPFNYKIIEDVVSGHYEGEQRTMTLLNIFMGLAILISLMGLFALSSFVMNSRIREMAVRKVLGATQSNILLAMGREFTLLVLFSTLLAWPLAWLATERWLDNFAYRQDPKLLYFAFAPLISLIAAWITVSYHAIKTARINPSDALKYE